jgi:hypothetical protein
MYEALDSFLNVSTWASFQREDEERFYRALDTIVRNYGFDPLEMGEYVVQRYNEQFGRNGEDSDKLRFHLADKAQTVWHCLHATGL